jgi:CHAT domain-containing protein/tetratricopeptide (TPR) repeat protein
VVQRSDRERVERLQDQFERAVNEKQYADALPLAEEVGALVRSLLGDNNSDYDACRENVAGTLFYLRRYQDAADLLQQVIRSREARSEDPEPEIVNDLEHLTQCYYSLGDFKSAEPYVRKLLAVRRRSGSGLTETVNLATCLREQGKNDEAEEMFREGLAEARQPSADSPRPLAFVLNNYGLFLKSVGRYREALSNYKEAVSILATLPAEQGLYFMTMANLANLYTETGDASTSELTYKDLFSKMEKAPGIAPLAKAMALNNQAEGHLQRGNYQVARKLLNESLEIVRIACGPTHPRYATALNNAGAFYLDIGDKIKAEDLFQQALDIRLPVLGEASLEVAQSYNNLGEIARDRGDLDRAIAHFRKAMAVKRRVYKAPHLSLATTMGNLGHLLMMAGQWDGAERMLQDTLTCLEASVGKEHPDYAETLQSLGDMHKRKGNYSRAESYLQQCLDILRREYGAGRSFAIATVNMAELYVATGRLIVALSYFKELDKLDQDSASRTFSVASEDQRMAFLRDVRTRTHVYLSCILAHRNDAAVSLRAAYEHVLRRKALGAEVLAAQHDDILGGRYPHLLPKLQELTLLRSQIATAVLAGTGPEEHAAHAARLKQWDSDRERLEAELAGSIPESELHRRLGQADLEAVTRKLPPDSVLVELVKLRVRAFKSVATRWEPTWDPERYIAFTLTPVGPNPVELVDLGEAESIDKLVTDYRSHVAAPPTGRDPRWRSAGIVLRKAVFDKLIPLLGARRRLFIAPDGDLSMLPFEALPFDDDRFVIDDYQITYLTCGRDALRFGLPPFREPADAIVVADPAFNLTAPSGQAAPSTDTSRHSGELDRGMRFGLLRHTRREGEQVAGLLGVRPWLGAEALDARVKSARSPRILHLATHGFVLTDQPSLPDTSDGAAGSDRVRRLRGAGMENPLLRSGLALAGVNIWLRGGTTPVEAEDGLLTAEDVTGMDLLDTELVVLSACETGLGMVHVGEGVFGLRRAFVLAGARRLVMSLWRVPDEQTQELMVDFYQRVIGGQAGVPESLCSAKLAMKASHPDPYYWGAFIAQGDPAPLLAPKSVGRPDALPVVE